MPAIKGIVLGQGSIVTDGRTLRGMAKAGHIVWPVTVAKQVHSGHPYVNDRKSDGTYLPTRFTYKGVKYLLKYFDGCFFQFVVRDQ